MKKSSDMPAVQMKPDSSANNGLDSESGQRTMALAVIKYAAVSDREILLRWARDLLQIRGSDQGALDKQKPRSDARSSQRRSCIHVKVRDGSVRVKAVYLALHTISRKWTMPIRDWKAALTRFTI